MYTHIYGWKEKNVLHQTRLPHSHMEHINFPMPLGKTILTKEDKGIKRRILSVYTSVTWRNIWLTLLKHMFVDQSFLLIIETYSRISTP